MLLVDITSSGWGDAVRQADDVGEFVDRIEAGTFAFDFVSTRSVSGRAETLPLPGQTRAG
ncbi:hypothetical protein ACQP1P_27695 [Dactylosporangium sp. CA-052675]|uniref:hypothetical protein n=1 Tax=Dactylosporangium sp. CA-052675 TaxID=3239927 RepID=UPI003D928A0C